MPHKHLYMGAVNKNTKEYTFPIHATKRDIYCCPSCNNDIIFKKGKIKTQHFAHKAHSSCCYYSNPGESEIHKEGKRLMKKLLDNKENILVYRKCKCCGETEEVFNILNQDYTNEMICRLEFCFDYNENKRWADIALLNGDDVKFIFEICNTHKTSEERQTNYEWCEIDASTFINETMTQENLNEDNEIEINCIRDIKCEECLELEKQTLQTHRLNMLKICIWCIYGRYHSIRNRISERNFVWWECSYSTFAAKFTFFCFWNKWTLYAKHCKFIEQKKENVRREEEQKKENVRREEEQKKENAKKKIIIEKKKEDKLNEIKSSYSTAAEKEFQEKMNRLMCR